MSIDRFYNKTFTIKRMVWTGNVSAESSTGSFSGHIQQARPEVAQQLSMVYTKSFIVWCDESIDVQEGDTLTEGSNTYSVKAVQSNIYGENQHKELIVEMQVRES